MSKKEQFKIAILDENPVFIMFLGLCPTLGTTARFSNALAMGVSVIFVLTMSNVVISLIRKLVPYNIRIPVYITIIATLVTIVEMVLEAVSPALYSSLGIFLPLIVVNCLILGRAESFASKNKVSASFWDGLTKGVAFALALLVIGFFRELLGTGEVAMLNFSLFNAEDGMAMLTYGAGGFITLGCLAWVFNDYKSNRAKKLRAQKGVNNGQ